MTTTTHPDQRRDGESSSLHDDDTTHPDQRREGESSSLLDDDYDDSDYEVTLNVCYAPAIGGGAFWNSAILPSVCPMAQLPRI